jgi:hypothetical protein
MCCNARTSARFFLIPGRGDTLQINGTARILADGEYFDAMCVKGRRPLLALEIDIEEVFFHCAKAFLRSDAWDRSTWNPTAVPSVAQIAKAIGYDWTQAELDERYSEDNIRKDLYRGTSASPRATTARRATAKHWARSAGGLHSGPKCRADRSWQAADRPTGLPNAPIGIRCPQRW